MKKSHFDFIEDKRNLTDEDKAIMNGDIAIYIFKDIDKLIETCSHRKQPVGFNYSQFKQEYNKCKEKWLE